MKLPNASFLLVDREKITDYLLNPQHRYGASKARFFSSFGFSLEVWEILALALRDQHEVRNVHDTIFGPRYEVDGWLKTPDGREPNVRTVWQLDHGSVAPRLITAYPLEPSDD